MWVRDIWVRDMAVVWGQTSDSVTHIYIFICIYVDIPYVSSWHIRCNMAVVWGQTSDSVTHIYLYVYTLVYHMWVRDIFGVRWRRSCRSCHRSLRPKTPEFVIYIYIYIYIFIFICDTLQHTALHCNALNTMQHTATHCNTLQHTATHCNTLQHTAAHCNTLQHTAAHCITPWAAGDHGALRSPAASHCNTLQRAATHCNALQHTATPSNTP